MNHIAAQPQATPARWYQGVTFYQWLVLVIASVGWVFDAFEGQVFNITRNDLLTDVLRVAHDAPQVQLWGDRFLAVFLAGGAFGGILFGSLADRFGRKPVMVATILFYSIFAGLTYFATTLWRTIADLMPSGEVDVFVDGASRAIGERRHDDAGVMAAEAADDERLGDVLVDR